MMRYFPLVGALAIPIRCLYKAQKWARTQPLKEASVRACVYVRDRDSEGEEKKATAMLSAVRSQKLSQR